MIFVPEPTVMSVYRDLGVSADIPAVVAALAGAGPRRSWRHSPGEHGRVRNPYAVLTARLSPSELPNAPGRAAVVVRVL